MGRVSGWGSRAVPLPGGGTTGLRSPEALRRGLAADTSRSAVSVLCFSGGKARYSTDRYISIPE